MTTLPRTGRSRVARVVTALTTALVTTALVTTAVAMTTAAGTPAGAQGAAPPGPAGPRVELVGQDPFTPVGGDVDLRLDVVDPPPGASLSFSVYQAVTARKTFDETFTPGSNTGTLVGNLGLVSRALDEIPIDESGARAVVLGLQSPTGARDVDRLNIRRPGVYPLVVDLRDADDRTVATFRTALVVAEADRPTVTNPLSVAWVWPLTAAPSFLPSGEPDPGVLGALRPEGRLGRMVAALSAVPDVPVTLAPGGETMEAWATLGRNDVAIQSVADTVRVVGAARQVLDGAYVPVDLPSLLEYGLAGAVDEAFARGTEALTAAFGPALDRRTRVARPASPAALARLRAAGAERVIVDPDSLAPGPEPRFTPAQPVLLRGGAAGGPLEPTPALVTDRGLENLLTATDLPAALRAQLVLAGLAVVAQEAPSIARVVTLVNPDDFDAPSALFTALLAGLRQNPFLQPVTVAQAFDGVPVDPPAPTVNPALATSERDLTAGTPGPPLVTAAAYQRQRTRLNAFGALTRPGDPAVGDADRSLLASLSSAWPLDEGRAKAEGHLGVVDRVVDDFVAKIEVPDPRTITLTSRSGEIPLTFRNETGAPIRLRAALSSAKLFFPDGNVVELDLPPRSTTVRVAVETRTSGTFPLDLEVTSIDGVLPISQRRLEVRSTFVSTVGVVLMVSAAAFLAVWWGFDLRRRRRRRTRTAET